MKFQIILVFSILLAACGAGVSPQATATLPAPTSTFTPTDTSTPAPTFTPTTTPTPRLPVLPGTQIPASRSAISTDNIDQVVELARWGKGVITDATFSPDGKLIAVATTVGFSIYQVDTLEEIREIIVNARVNSIAFSPNGKIVATGSNDNTMKLWDISGSELLTNLNSTSDEPDGEQPEVTSVAFSPSGELLAGGFTDGTVSIWQVSDGSLLRTLKNHTDRVNSVFFSPDEKEIFSASRDGKVHLVDTADGRITHTFLGVSITNASLSNDGKTLATYDTYYYYSGGVRDTEEKLILWDVETGNILENIVEQGFIWNNTTDLAFSPNSQFIGAALEDRSIQIWETTTGDLKNTLNDLVPNSSYYLNDFTLSFSPDSQLLLMAGANVIGVWDIQKGALLKSATIKTEEFVDIALSPDQNVLAVVEGPNVNLLQVSDGTLLPNQDQIQSNGSLAFSPDGASLLVSMFNGSAQLLPLSDQGIRKSFDIAPYTVRGVSYSPDGQTVAIGKSNTGEAELYQVADGVLVRTLYLGPRTFVRRVSYSPDGKYLAVSSLDRIRLFQLSDGKLLQTFNRGPNIAFSPDGNTLAGGYSDKTISVWNVPDGKLLYLIKNGPDSVSSLAYSFDGKLLAAGFADGTIEVFSTTDGSLLHSWNEHLRTVSGLAFAPDGRYLISSSYDGTIRVWGIKP